MKIALLCVLSVLLFDVEAEVVYPNYGTAKDFKKLQQLKVDVRGKIVLVRYGQNFRGILEMIVLA